MHAARAQLAAQRIDARASRGRGVPPSYEARFCLARQPDGGLLVRQIVPGAPSGRRAGAR